MSIDQETDWGWVFARGFSTLVEPVARLTEFGFRLMTPTDPKIFDNYSTVFQEKVYRGLVGTSILGGTALTLALVPAGILVPAVLGYGFCLLTSRLGAYYLQSAKGYTYVKGGMSPLEKTEFSLMNWNVCGIWGGISRSNGGVLEWRLRFDKILAVIQQQKPDVLILEEIYDTALAERLVDSLRGEYAHFYTIMGPNVRGSVGGLFVATKLASSGFSHTSFENNTWELNRGFATLELAAGGRPCATVIGTHLIHGDQSAKRQSQVAQLVASVAKKTLPAFVAGDLNQTPEEFRNSMGKHVYQEPPDTITCTDAFIREGWNPNVPTPDERLDYIAQVKNEAPEATMNVRDLCLLYNKTSQTALSDHDAQVAQIQLAR